MLILLYNRTTGENMTTERRAASSAQAMRKTVLREVETLYRDWNQGDDRWCDLYLLSAHKAVHLNAHTWANRDQNAAVMGLIMVKP